MIVGIFTDALQGLLKGGKFVGFVVCCLSNSERKILAATAAGMERVGGVEVIDVHIVGAAEDEIRRDVHAIKHRPAEILTGRVADLQRFPVIPADVSNVDGAGIALRGIEAPGAGPQRNAERVAAAHRPHARLGGLRIRGVVKGVARDAVARGRVNAKNFSLRQSTSCARYAPTFSFARMIPSLKACGAKLPLAVPPVSTCQAVAPSPQETSNVPSWPRRLPTPCESEQGEAVRFRLAKQHQPTGESHGAKIIHRRAGVARHPADGRRRVFVGGRIVIGGSVVKQMMPVHGVKQINVTVWWKSSGRE